MTQHVLGMTRVKNEARWIDRVIRAILPLCEHVYVLDDHSTDDTPAICRAIPNVTVIDSQSTILDETADKNLLLNMIMDAVPNQAEISGRHDSPWWVLGIDGDEELVPGGQQVIAEFIKSPDIHAAKLPIRYLWDSLTQVRVDGVYATFARPSLFRLMNRQFTFQSTPWGGNFHCSSIPQELLHHAHPLCVGADLLHYGYMDKADRLRKYEFYNRIDPGNVGEDFYRHILIGDTAEFPADSRFRYGGPLKIEELARVCA